MKYFDNAATTKISKSSLEAYVQASENFFNASSLYQPAVKSKNIIEQARQYFLKALKAKQGSTLVFTGSASESNNAVINSCITRKDKKYIFSAGEHSSVYETAKKYKDAGYNVVFIPLNDNGSVNTDELVKELDSYLSKDEKDGFHLIKYTHKSPVLLELTYVDFVGIISGGITIGTFLTPFIKKLFSKIKKQKETHPNMLYPMPKKVVVTSIYNENGVLIKKIEEIYQ